MKLEGLRAFERAVWVHRLHQRTTKEQNGMCLGRGQDKCFIDSFVIWRMRGDSESCWHLVVDEVVKFTGEIFTSRLECA